MDAEWRGPVAFHFSSCGRAARIRVRKLQNDLTYDNQRLWQKASRTDKVKQGNGNSIAGVPTMGSVNCIRATYQIGIDFS